MNFTMTPPPVNPMYDVVGGMDITPTYEEAKSAEIERSMLRSGGSSIWRMGERIAARTDTTQNYYTPDEWKDSQYYRPGLEFNQGVGEEEAQMTAYDWDYEQKRNEAIDSFEGSYWESSKLLAFDLFQQMKDPINVASAFIPITYGTKLAQAASYGATLGSRTAARLGVGAIEGAVGNAIVEPFILAAAKADQAGYSVEESLLNVAMGIPLGSVFHGVGGGLAEGAGRVFGIKPQRLSPLAKEKMVETAKSQTKQGREQDVGDLAEMDMIANEDLFPPDGARGMVRELDPKLSDGRMDNTDVIAVEGARRGLIQTPDDFYRGIALVDEFEGWDGIVKTIDNVLTKLDGNSMVRRINLEKGLMKIRKDLSNVISNMYGEPFDVNDPIVKQWTAVLIHKILDGDIKIKSPVKTEGISRSIRSIEAKIFGLNRRNLRNAEVINKINIQEAKLLNEMEGHHKKIVEYTDLMYDADIHNLLVNGLEMDPATKRGYLVAIKELQDKIDKAQAKIPGLNKKRNAKNIEVEIATKKAQLADELEELETKKQEVEAERSVDISTETREALEDTLGDLPPAREAKAQRMRKVMDGTKEAPYVDAEAHAEASARIDEENARVSGKEGSETFLEERDINSEVVELESRLRSEDYQGNMSEEFNEKVRKDLDEATMTNEMLNDNDVFKGLNDCVLGEVS